MDTTRADALGCYGGTRGVSPHLDALARESLVFERARTVAPITLPAHASLLTGLYPLRHAVRDNGLRPLPPEARTLAELARERGYQTGAVVASPVLDPLFGLDQGFDAYVAAGIRAESTVYGSVPARTVVDRALDWLRKRDPARPFFLWVHLYDPHAPYDPPPEHRAGRTGNELYYGEIAAMDAEIGRLLASLRSEGALDSAAVVVTADHGEALGEHGEETHGVYCFETTLRVPLILRMPDGTRAGEREAGPVSLVDLFPTLATAMGVPAEGLGDIDGTSLWRRPPPAARGLYFESCMGYLDFGWSLLTGWVRDERKLLESPAPRAFDLGLDPGEEHDLLAAGALDPEPFRGALADLAARPRLPSAPAAGLDADLAAQLAALGYVGDAAPAPEVPEPLAPSDRPSPMERLEDHARLLGAIDRIQAGDDAGALPLLERFLARTPESSLARGQLAAALLRLGRPAEALPHLERLAAEPAPRSQNLQNLASAHVQLARFDEAMRALRRVLDLDPTNAVALEALAHLLARTGHADEADAVRARLPRAPR